MTTPAPRSTGTTTTGTATVRDRMLAVGISPEAFEGHLRAGRLIVAGRRVHDPDTPAPDGTDIGIGLTGAPG